MRLKFALALVCSFAACPAAGQPVPPDLNQFGLICYCNSRISTPHRLVAMDNNGQVLFATRNGATREQLKAAGLAFSESQLTMLKDWGLLTEKQKVLTTNFPVVDPDRMASIRAKLEPLADELLPQLQPHILAIKAELRKRHHEEWLYSVLFSYVLDGKTWNILDNSGRMPNTDITVEHPFWAGAFYAIYPKQDSNPGTNSRRVDDAIAEFTWTKATVDQSNNLQNSDAVQSWLKVLSDGATSRPSPSAGFAPLVIHEDRGDPIFTAGVQMGNLIGRTLAATDFSAELPNSDSSERLIIAAHELIWILLADLQREYRIATPAVLSKGAARPADLAPVTLVRIRKRGTTSGH